MKKIIKKAHKFRLEPTKEQRTLFAQFAGCARFVYNRALAKIKKALDAGEKMPTYYDAATELPLLKASEDTKWLKVPHSQILQQALMHLHRGVQYFFDNRKENPSIGMPRFKKRGRKDSFRYPQNIKCMNGKVFLPKIGWVNYKDSRAILGTIKQAVIKREGKHWFITIFVEVEVDIDMVPILDEEAVGLDVGISCFVATSNGDKVPNPAYYHCLLDRLRYLCKELSRKKKYSKNWEKCLNKIRRLHTRIKNLRNNFLHKLSTLITKNHGVVCVENLAINEMVKDKRFARAISDAGWGRFISFVRYKCEWQGKHFSQVSRWFPSSQLCSSCGNRQDMPVQIRVFKCKACGLKLDRDINASINIRSAGLSALKACGATE